MSVECSWVEVSTQRLASGSSAAGSGGATGLPIAPCAIATACYNFFFLFSANLSARPVDHSFNLVISRRASE